MSPRAIQTVQTRLADRMQALREDRTTYREWRVAMVREAGSGDAMRAVLANKQRPIRRERQIVRIH